MRAHERGFVLVGQRRVVARVERRHNGQGHGGGREQGKDRVELGRDRKLGQLSWTWPPGIQLRQIGDNPLTFRLRLARLARNSTGANDA